MALSSPLDILSRLSSSFEKARSSGDLLFYSSSVHKHTEIGVEFEIRLCPALQKKPVLPVIDIPNEDNKQAQKNAKPDPFAPPYNPNLLVGEVEDKETEVKYAVVLNKYSVVPHHFLLVTQEFQPQSMPLMPQDLLQTYLLLSAARNTGKPLLAFYNCGERSGASQAHKHIQFIPLDEGEAPVEQLARSVNLEYPDKAFSMTALPYANHIFRFPGNTPQKPPVELAQILSQAFLTLLDLVISTIRHDPDYPPGRPSYNVFMTLEHLHLIPRKEEFHVLQDTGENLAVNSLGFAGMLLVKSDKELEAVKSEGVCKILNSVALKSVVDEQVSAGTDDVSL